MLVDIAALRQNYALHTLSESDVASDPFEQYRTWFHEAVNSQLPEPNAFILATAGADGRPGARTVLLKEFTRDGFVFYTNYESRKGRELLENPNAAMLFMWLELQRQVRIEGVVEKVGAAESLAYFQSRPRASQIGAWASHQSSVADSREEIERRQQEVEARFEGFDVLPLPPFWGGYRLKPDSFEYWQGRESRLHDRIAYRKSETDGWDISRLMP
ncbi:MAG: pyridoxamine 5'-phosphate oxidase [Bacteroidota bacterium]